MPGKIRRRVSEGSSQTQERHVCTIPWLTSPRVGIHCYLGQTQIKYPQIQEKCGGKLCSLNIGYDIARSMRQSLHRRVDANLSRAGQLIEGGARPAVSRFEVVPIERYQSAAGLENRVRFH